MKKAARAAAAAALALLCAAAGWLWNGVQYESYTRRELASGLELDTAGMELPELYAALLPLCGDFVQEHDLTQIEGSLAAGGGALDYGEAEFSFFQYVDDRAEGGRVSVVTVTVNDGAPGAVTVWEFYGAGKASGTPSQPLLAAPETLPLAQAALERQAAEQPEAERFRVWRTEAGAGELRAEVYDG